VAADTHLARAHVSRTDPYGSSAPKPATDQKAARVVGLGAVVLLVAAALAYYVLNRGVGRPPPEIAGDRLLVSGREVYLNRCLSCHGPKGRGDGPIAKGMRPPVGDLTDGEWKHGDQPEQVLAVMNEGVRDSSMPGYSRILTASEVRAVTAYVYHLAGRTVPAALRAP
jgi:cytochrome c oxidase cbb3-type subunit 3